jgi:hypothetical protein
MAQLPIFFFSHARHDREMPGNFLTKFFKDLELRLRAAGGFADVELGVIDKRIEHGKDWDTELSTGLTKSRAFIAIFTPLYFTRENCGKELGEFLLRNPNLALDAQGSLANVENVLPVRWYRENFYKRNAGKSSIIPAFLSRIEDTPSGDVDEDEERTAAINRYRTKGMESCVDNQPHYRELLDLFVERILSMQDLPPPPAPVSFATARDAFSLDWAQRLGAQGPGAVPAPAAPAMTSEAPAVPRPIADAVAFYVTNRAYAVDPDPIAYAEQLLEEPIPGTPAQTDAALAELISDLRKAGEFESFTVFNVTSAPARLLQDLSGLSASRVPLLLILDTSVWDTPILDEIIRSQGWTGLVLLAAFDGNIPDADALMKARGLPPRIFSLPSESRERIPALCRALVEARGRAMRAGTEQAPGAQPMPYITGNK